MTTFRCSVCGDPADVSTRQGEPLCRSIACFQRIDANVVYKATVIAASPRAICCNLNGDRVEHWIARSQIEVGSTVHHGGDTGRLVVSAWFAQTARLPKGEKVDMPQYDNSNSGALFSNKDHQTNEKAPNLKGPGRVTIGGVEYELDIAGWVKQSEKAGKFISLRIKLKGEQPMQQRVDNAGLGKQQFNQRVQAMGTEIDF
jgi:hypothetical protein